MLIERTRRLRKSSSSSYGGARIPAYGKVYQSQHQTYAHIMDGTNEEILEQQLGRGTGISLREALSEPGLMSAPRVSAEAFRASSGGYASGKQAVFPCLFGVRSI